MNNLKHKNGKPAKDWILDTFKYDGYANPPVNGSGNTTGTGNTTGNTTSSDKSDGKTPKPLGSFTTYSSFQTESMADYKLYNTWTLDGGSDTHVCNDESRSNWAKTRDAQPGDQLFAGKTSYPIEAFGTVTIHVDTPDGPGEIRLTNVALAPGFMTNLVSLDLLNSKGVHWNSKYPTKLQQNRRDFCNLYRVGKHWVLQKDAQTSTHLGAFPTTSSHVPREANFTGKEMHLILGHVGTEVIGHVSADDITIDHSVLCPTTIECQTCSLAKATKLVSRRPEVEVESDGSPFFHIAWDMIEFETGYNSDNYTSHIYYRELRFEFVATHPRKTDTLVFFTKIINIIEKHFNAKIRFCQLDGETSFDKAFEDHVLQKGIIPERTAPDTSDQNGGLERAGGVLVVKSRSMSIEANLPTELWPEVVKAGGYIKNRTPTRKLGWKTPYEAVRKIRPTYAHMHPYGCRAYALRRKIPKKDKLAQRAHLGYLVGYDSRNIYRIWIPSRARVIRTRDVTFDHNSFWTPDDLDIGDILREDADQILDALDLPQIGTTDIPDDEVLDFIVVDHLSDHTQEAGPETEESSDREEGVASRDTPNCDTPQQLLTPEESPEPTIGPMPTIAPAPAPESEPTNTRFISAQNEPVAPGSRQFAGIDAGNVITSRRRNAYLTTLAHNHELAGYYSAFSAALRTTETRRPHRDTLPEPPKTYRRIKSHIHATEFEAACDKEYKALFSKDMFTYIDNSKVPEGTQLLPLMWVLSYKFDKDGYLDRHKARLVARGDLQVDQDDTYATTLAAQTFRAIMAITAAFDLEIKQYDAVNAFANALLPTPLYFICPEGYEKAGKVLKATRAIYGLRKSPLLWYNELTLSLKKLGIKPVPETSCLFMNDWLILLFYVDDIIAVYSPRDQDRMTQFEAKLLALYEFRVLGDATHFLGIRIIRDRPNRKLWLVQDSYIQKLAERFHITVTKPPKTPLPSVELVPYEGQATASQIYSYQQRAGSINFAAIITRPDIAKAHSKLSEFMQNPSPAHATAIEQALHYLVGTKYRAILYDGKAVQKRLFTTSSDSAFADNRTTRFSSYGYCFSLYSGVIHYKAVKGRTVTTSSTEAELLAISLTAKEFIKWIRFFTHINFDLDEHPTIYCDNQQTIRILTKEAPKLNTALKHVDIHQSWLRQEVQEGRIKVEWVPTADMIADGFTKVLPAQKHANFVRQLNLVDVSDLLQES